MFKRLFDITTSGIALVVLSPLLLILALVVKCSSLGPVFYRATRVGLNGKIFKLFKFRSMANNADQIGPGITGAEDSRITPVGRFLRRTKLDELPQLINVFSGEMSLVGPRPEDPRYVAIYTDAQRQVLTVKPGITSPASVAYRNEEAMLTDIDWETYYIKHLMPAKLAIDLKYAQDPSVLKDIAIILQTARALFS